MPSASAIPPAAFMRSPLRPRSATRDLAEATDPGSGVPVRRASSRWPRWAGSFTPTRRRWPRPRRLSLRSQRRRGRFPRPCPYPLSRRRRRSQPRSCRRHRRWWPPMTRRASLAILRSPRCAGCRNPPPRRKRLQRPRSRRRRHPAWPCPSRGALRWRRRRQPSRRRRRLQQRRLGKANLRQQRRLHQLRQCLRSGRPCQPRPCRRLRRRVPP
jgi:hypothetical protein